MTLEEALMAILAAVAAVMLFLGLAQALDSRPPRELRRRHRGPGLPAGSIETSSVGLARASNRPPERSGIPFADVIAQSEDRAVAAAVAALPVSDTPSAASEVPPVEEAPPLVSAPIAPALAAEPRSPASAIPSLDRDPTLVEHCAALFLAGRHREVLAATEPRLLASADLDGAGPSHTTAALWSLSALSHRALGDDRLAASALAEGVAALPRSVGEGCPPRLAAMSLSVARRLIEVAEQSPDGVEDRITAPRLAAFWLGWRLVAAPGDPDSLALLESVHAALAEGYADLISAAIQRHEWDDARRLISAAAAPAELPPARAAVLAEVVAASLRLEVDRLTSPAVRGVKDESRIVAGLGHADALLASMSGTALPARQRTAMTRRIWRGYVSLGLRRLRSGRVGEAADALLRALGMSEIGRRRQRQVKDGVVSALEAMGSEKLSAVTRLLEEGDRSGAAVEVDDLVSTIQRARDGGIPPDALVSVSARARELAQRVESPSAT